MLGRLRQPVRGLQVNDLDALAAEIRRRIAAKASKTKSPGWPDGSHGVQPDGRWNFIHSHVGNRKTRRAKKAKGKR